MHTVLIFAASTVAFAAFLRLRYYVDLEDGLALGAVFSAICFLVAHFA